MLKPLAVPLKTPPKKTKAIKSGNAKDNSPVLPGLNHSVQMTNSHALLGQDSRALVHGNVFHMNHKFFPSGHIILLRL